MEIKYKQRRKKRREWSENERKKIKSGLFCFLRR